MLITYLYIDILRRLGKVTTYEDLKNVLYEECSICGERVTSPKVSQKLYEKVKNKQFIEEIVKVPVLDAAYG
ncbi:hypothetical protein GMMP15_910039 [Candidatus Magnetomoraceae bacterium gMMP-15]